MKILLATDNFYPNVNGAANFAYELATGLIKNGYTIAAIAPAQKFDNTITKHAGITIYGIRSIMIPLQIHPGKTRIPLVDPDEIEKIIRKIKPDVIHIQDHFFIGNQVVKAAKKLSIPIIGTNHFMPDNLIHYLHPPAFIKQPLSGFAWKQFLQVYGQLDIVTTPTQIAADLIRKIGLQNTVVPISCGVQLNRFHPGNKGSYLKKRYQIPSSKPIILFVGRLDKEKNINVIIKAFVKVVRSCKTQLVIAGMGKEEENLINLTQQFNIKRNVTFTGFISAEDLPNLYSIASVFVIASTAELQSIATMEAMASGLPVIAAKAVALPELVHHNQNGYLFKAGSIKELTHYMMEIINNPLLRKRLSQRSLGIIRKHKLESTIKSYEKMYANLVAARTLPGPTRKHFFFNRV